MTSPTTPSLPDALRACIEKYVVAVDNVDDQLLWAYSDIANRSFIRQHGPALEQSLRSLADENQALLRGVASSDAPTSSQAPPFGEWQPIEQAPKDGTLMDMWRNDGVRVPDVYWLHEFGSWNCVRAGTHYTHWMPLPAGPNGAKGDVDQREIAHERA